MPSVLIVDNHPLYRLGVKSSIKAIDPAMTVIEAADGQEAISISQNEKVDIIFMDINMPILNGIKATEIIREKNSTVKILALSFFDDPYHVIRMIEAGANGYSTKELTLVGLKEIISVLLNGGFYISMDVKKHLEKYYSEKKSKSLDSKLREELTMREIEVLSLLCNQLSTKEISAKLDISTRTVETHRENILVKTCSTNIVGLVLYAIEKGIVVSPS
jgi:DNA-binding NarL/FixJ family response regulator